VQYRIGRHGDRQTVNVALRCLREASILAGRTQTTLEWKRFYLSCLRIEAQDMKIRHTTGKPHASNAPHACLRTIQTIAAQGCERNERFFAHALRATQHARTGEVCTSCSARTFTCVRCVRCVRRRTTPNGDAFAHAFATGNHAFVRARAFSSFIFSKEKGERS
jgi:hypothetical protein